MKQKLLLEEDELIEKVSSEDVEGTVEAAKIIMDQLPKDNDKTKWASTATKVIDALPKETYTTIADLLNSKVGNVKVDDKTKQVVANETDTDMQTANGWKTVGDILGYLDLVELTRNNPGALKAILIAILTVVAIIEPTPVGEIITAVVTVLPNNVIGKVLEILGYTNPIHWIRKGVLALADKKATNEEMDEFLDVKANIGADLHNFGGAGNDVSVLGIGKAFGENCDKKEKDIDEFLDADVGINVDAHEFGGNDNKVDVL